MAVIPARILPNFRSGHSGTDLHIPLEGGIRYWGTLSKSTNTNTVEIQTPILSKCMNQNENTIEPILHCSYVVISRLMSWHFEYWLKRKFKDVISLIVMGWITQESGFKVMFNVIEHTYICIYIYIYIYVIIAWYISMGKYKVYSFLYV